MAPSSEGIWLRMKMFGHSEGPSDHEDLAQQMEVSLTVCEPQIKAHHSRNKWHQHEFMHPDWMLDVPHDITENW